MVSSSNAIKYATISLIACTVLFVSIYLSSSWLNIVLKSIVERPDELFATARILLIILSTLVSYIIYLILSGKTRAVLEAERMTKSLSTSLEQLNSIYEESPVPFITIDKKGNIVDQNKAALRFFGVVPQEILNKNLFQMMPDEEKDKSEKLLLYYKSNLAINMQEVRMVTKDGKVRWVILSVFKIEIASDSKHAGLATMIDITERKQLDKAKTEFVSLASHQLRTPAATIKWYVDMMLAGDVGELAEKEMEYLTRIKKVNENMIELVETLLNVSRVEIGSISVDLKKTNVAQIVDSVLLELSADIETKALKITKNYGGNLENMETDPKLLRIIIQNLLSNSIKYTPKSGSVKISLEESWGEKSIVISDSGMGIPEEDKDKIFTKLFRAENVKTMSENQGTGLGLYLVKSIVEAMGGSIEFTSELNRGSTFIVKI